MSFEIHPGAWAPLSDLTLIVAHGSGIDNATPNPGVEAFVLEAQEFLRKSLAASPLEKLPGVAALRNLMEGRLGLPPQKFPSSVESLCRMAVRAQGLRSINPLIDLGNALSVRFQVPVGLWDTAALRGGRLVLRFSDGGERFTELGKTAPVTVSSGELCYTDAEEVITRHFVWRQSETAKITSETSAFVFVSEVSAAVGSSVADEIRGAFEDAMRDCFGVRVRSARLAVGSPGWRWE